MRKINLLSLIFGLIFLMPLLVKADPIVQQKYKIEIYALGLQTPMGLAFDSQGNLFVADDSYSIYKITPDGNFSIYVADLGAGKILKVTPNGIVSLFSSSVQKPSDVVFNPVGEMFVSYVGFDSILKVFPNGDVTTYYSEVGVPLFQNSGDMFLANPSYKDFLKIKKGTWGSHLNY